MVPPCRPHPQSFLRFADPPNGAAGLEQRRKTYLLTQGRLDVCRM